jgi:putative transposase
LTAGSTSATILSCSPVHGASRCRGFSQHYPRGHRHGPHYYSEINLHLTWHTKDNTPLLVANIETETHRYLKGRCINTPGVFIHEIGGIEDHVHLCITIPPTLLISDFVGQLKGASSHEMNQKFRDDAGKVLQWQAGYGVVSFGTRDLKWVMEYVRNQRERHGKGQIEDRLERITEKENG